MKRPHIPAALRRLVVQRAGERCEYCTLGQSGQAATFHIDHVQPVARGGETTAYNLALACVSCSLRKAARIAAEDPESGASVAIFSPRLQRWDDHFRWDGEAVVGRTPTGRATVAALSMNRPMVVAIRREEARIGRHPPVAMG